jgi:hypothetical protein
MLGFRLSTHCSAVRHVLEVIDHQAKSKEWSCSWEVHTMLLLPLLLALLLLLLLGPRGSVIG